MNFFNKISGSKGKAPVETSKSTKAESSAFKEKRDVSIGSSPKAKANSHVAGSTSHAKQPILNRNKEVALSNNEAKKKLEDDIATVRTLSTDKSVEPKALEQAVDGLIEAYEGLRADPYSKKMIGTTQSTLVALFKAAQKEQDLSKTYDQQLTVAQEKIFDFVDSLEAKYSSLKPDEQKEVDASGGPLLGQADWAKMLDKNLNNAHYNKGE